MSRPDAEGNTQTLTAAVGTTKEICVAMWKQPDLNLFVPFMGWYAPAVVTITSGDATLDKTQRDPDTNADIFLITFNAVGIVELEILQPGITGPKLITINVN